MALKKIASEGFTQGGGGDVVPDAASKSDKLMPTKGSGSVKRKQRSGHGTQYKSTEAVRASNREDGVGFKTESHGEGAMSGSKKGGSDKHVAHGKTAYPKKLNAAVMSQSMRNYKGGSDY